MHQLSHDEVLVFEVRRAHDQHDVRVAQLAPHLHLALQRVLLDLAAPRAARANLLEGHGAKVRMLSKEDIRKAARAELLRNTAASDARVVRHMACVGRCGTGSREVVATEDVHAREDLGRRRHWPCEP